MPPQNRKISSIEKINLNLDTVEREQVYEPYVVVVDGHPITMTDPKDLDWKVLLTIDRPSQFFAHVVSDEDKQIFKKAMIEGWKMEMLLRDYQTHYGLGTPGNGDASPI